MAFPCDSCKPTMKKVLEAAQDIQEDILVVKSKNEKLMNMLEEMVKEKGAEKMKEASVNIRSQVVDRKESLELTSIDVSKKGQDVCSQKSQDFNSLRDEKIKEDGEINTIFKSEDIRNKRVKLEDSYEKKWRWAIEQEKQAYLDEIKAKVIPNVEVEFSLIDGCVIGKINVDSKHIQDLPAAEDLMTVECSGFCQKAKVVKVTGFKDFSIDVKFKNNFDTPDQKKFNLNYVPLLWKFKKMEEAVLNLNMELREILTGQFKSQKR